MTGGLEGEEKVVDGALRELEEETGFTTDDLEALYGLDQVNLFHADRLDALMADDLAARVRPSREPRLSHEHDAFRWLSPDDAREAVVWPAYRSAIARLGGSTPIPSTHLAPGRPLGGRDLEVISRLGGVIEQDGSGGTTSSRRARPLPAFDSKVDQIRPTYGFEDVSLAPGAEDHRAQ